MEHAQFALADGRVVARLRDVQLQFLLLVLQRDALLTLLLDQRVLLLHTHLQQLHLATSTQTTSTRTLQTVDSDRRLPPAHERDVP